ncbi:hypothetical protein CMI42_00685 [Candidatus Pacearchaeota archaeon]|nr:hypothetical protein [Candidatus Pacearchaeota archaeon]|tara:strand:+ start:2651 stop:3127 length:477 start_codon:yes stop_codon:yes gene_type:complete
MLRVLFDTNIYGEIVEDDVVISERITEAIIDDERFQVHNFRVIRDELRKIKKLVHLYDDITTNRIITVTPEIEDLTKEYFKEYKKNGGVQSDNINFMNDLRIVACVSIKGFDVIVSNDEKTMKNPIAIKSYGEINLLRSYRAPTFFNYRDLKRKYSIY